jgi:hypothetical protein
MGINTTGKLFSQAHKQGSVIMRVSNTSALMCKVLALAGLCSISLFALAQDTSGHVTGTNPYPYNTVDPREEVPEPIELPDDVLPMLESLSPEDIELLKSGRA